MSEAKCVTGWGEFSLNISPHPDRSFHSRSTLPLQGRVNKNIIHEKRPAVITDY